MKLILENVDGVYYAYRESNSQFANVELQRKTRLDAAMLDNECNLSHVLPPGTHMVFELKKVKE